jgi:hypothetical protein
LVRFDEDKGPFFNDPKVPEFQDFLVWKRAFTQWVYTSEKVQDGMALLHQFNIHMRHSPVASSISEILVALLGTARTFPGKRNELTGKFEKEEVLELLCQLVLQYLKPADQRHFWCTQLHQFKQGQDTVEELMASMQTVLLRVKEARENKIHTHGHVLPPFLKWDQAYPGTGQAHKGTASLLDPQGLIEQVRAKNTGKPAVLEGEEAKEAQEAAEKAQEFILRKPNNGWKVGNSRQEVTLAQAPAAFLAWSKLLEYPHRWSKEVSYWMHEGDLDGWKDSTGEVVPRTDIRTLVVSEKNQFDLFKKALNPKIREKVFGGVLKDVRTLKTAFQLAKVEERRASEERYVRQKATSSKTKHSPTPVKNRGGQGSGGGRGDRSSSQSDHQRQPRDRSGQRDHGGQRDRGGQRDQRGQGRSSLRSGARYGVSAVQAGLLEHGEHTFGFAQLSDPGELKELRVSCLAQLEEFEQGGAREEKGYGKSWVSRRTARVIRVWSDRLKEVRATQQGGPAGQKTTHVSAVSTQKKVTFGEPKTAGAAAAAAPASPTPSDSDDDAAFDALAASVQRKVAARSREQGMGETTLQHLSLFALEGVPRRPALSGVVRPEDCPDWLEALDESESEDETESKNEREVDVASTHTARSLSKSSIKSPSFKTHSSTAPLGLRKEQGKLLDKKFNTLVGGNVFDLAAAEKGREKGSKGLLVVETRLRDSPRTPAMEGLLDTGALISVLNEGALPSALQASLCPTKVVVKSATSEFTKAIGWIRLKGEFNRDPAQRWERWVLVVPHVSYKLILGIGFMRELHTQIGLKPKSETVLMRFAEKHVQVHVSEPKKSAAVAGMELGLACVGAGVVPGVSGGAKPVELPLAEAPGSRVQYQHNGRLRTTPDSKSTEVAGDGALPTPNVASAVSTPALTPLSGSDQREERRWGLPSPKLCLKLFMLLLAFFGPAPGEAKLLQAEEVQGLGLGRTIEYVNPQLLVAAVEERVPVRSFGTYAAPTAGEVTGQTKKKGRRRWYLSPGQAQKVWVKVPPEIADGPVFVTGHRANLEAYPMLAIPKVTGVVGTDRAPIPLMVHNHGTVPVHLPRHAELFKVESAIDWEITVLDLEGAHEPLPAVAPSWKELAAELDLESSPLTKQEKKEVVGFVKGWTKVFAKNPKYPPAALVPPHVIMTKEGTKPVSSAPYSVSEVKRKFLDSWLSGALESGEIVPSKSAWAAPLCLALPPPTKRKEGVVNFRICGDYRKLNMSTIPDRYPLPKIRDNLRRLGGHKWFSTLDACSGFKQIPMDVPSGSQAKTAFICHRGLFEFTRMPFGLVNASATFQRTMNVVLSGLSYRVCLVYIDDIIIFSPSFSEHLADLDSVFSALYDAGISLKASKCRLFRTEVEYLGHLVSLEGIAPLERVVLAVKNWPIPGTVKAVQSFMGLANYYRKFVENYAELSKPLTRLTRKNVKFVWTQKCQAAFQALKTALTSAPVLRHFDPTRKVIFVTDASKLGLGCVVEQEFEDGRHPIRFASRGLSGDERKWAVRELEALAIIWALEEHRVLIDQVFFDVETDHGSLQWLLESNGPGRIGRWALRLQEFKPFMTVKYRPGKGNFVADALSRCPLLEGGVAELCTCVLSPTPEHEVLHRMGVLTRDPAVGVACTCEERTQSHTTDLLGIRLATGCLWRILCHMDMDVQENLDPSVPFLPGGEFGKSFQVAQRASPEYGKVLKFLEAEGQGNFGPALRAEAGNYAVRAGFLCRWVTIPSSRRKSRPKTVVLRVVVPEPFVEQVLDLAHNRPVSGHAKGGKMRSIVLRRFWWPGAGDHIKKWCKACPHCQLCNGVQPRRQGELVLKNVTKVNGVLSVDLVGPFPIGPGKEIMILTIVDVFSRWPVLVPLRSTTADVVAEAIWRHWISIYGVPEKILTDQGPQFEAELFEKLCVSLGVEKARTTAYHPQTNAQAERFHRYLVPTLKALEEHSRDWVKFVPYVEFAYRTQDLEGFGVSPYQIMFGRDPRLPLDLYSQEASLEAAVDRVKYASLQSESCKVVWDLVKEIQQVSNQKNKTRYDKSHKPVAFEVGSQVLVWVPPRVVGSHKLERKFRGPFTVLAKKSAVTYKVKRVATGRELVVHVNRMAPYFDQGAWNDVPVRKPRGAALPLPEGPQPESREEEGEAGHLEQVMVDVANTTHPKLFVAPSSIPGAGRGVFARKDLPPHSVLCEYKGEWLTKSEYLGRYPKEDGQYVFDLKGRYLDASDPKTGSVARFVNCPGPEDSPNAAAVFDSKSKRLFIVSTRSIGAGEEVTYEYGDSYDWEQGERKNLSGSAKREVPPLVGKLTDIFGEIGRNSGGPDESSPAEPEEKQEENPPAGQSQGLDGAYTVGSFFLGWCVVEKEQYVGKIVQLDELGEFLIAHTYGSYDQDKPLDSKRWAKAYHSKKDSKVVFSNKSRKPESWDPWLWKVLPGEIQSEPFSRLVRGKLPPNLRVWA